MTTGVVVGNETNIPQFLTGEPQDVKDNLVGYAKRLEGRINSEMYLDADKFIQGNTKMFDDIHSFLGERVTELGRRVATILGREIPDHSQEHAGKYLNLIVALVSLDAVHPPEAIAADGSLVKRHGLPQLAADAAEFTPTTATPIIAESIKLVSAELAKSATSALSQFMQFVDTYESKGGKDSVYVAKLFAESPIDLRRGDSAGMAMGYLADKASLLPQVVAAKFRSEYSKLSPEDKESYVEDATNKLLLVYDMRKAVAEYTVGKILGRKALDTGSRW